MNGDGVCNVTDAVLFNTAYQARSLRADWNLDCRVDIAEVSRFYRILGSGTSAHSILDFNLDGMRNIADVQAFASAWSQGSSLANITNRYASPPQGDCATDIADPSLWMAWYTRGCP